METTTAPYRALRRAIRPEWLSAGTTHLFMGNYVVLFADAAQNFFAALGLDTVYMETHDQHYVAGGLKLLYEREIYADDVAVIDILVADTDDRRVHLALEMYREGETRRACFAEMLFVNVSTATGRSTPWGADIGAQLAAMRAEHDTLPRPHGFGDIVEIKRR
jgi:acyl-CoA thioester hydrolase